MSSRPVEIRQRRRPAELRGALIEAGRQLFAEQGYPATTQKQIAAAAGVSTSVLFRNFGSKSQLLVDAVIEPFSEFADDLVELTASASTTDGGLARMLVTDLVARLRPHRDSLRSLLSALPTPDGDALLGEMGERLDPIVKDLATAVVGRVPGADRKDTELELRLLLGMTTLWVVLDDWLLPDGLQSGDPRSLDVLAAMVPLGAQAPAEVQPPRVTVPTVAAPELAERRSPTSRRGSDEVRAALLDAATWLFRSSGYSATGYRDIATSAGTSESTLFRHFGSKSNLLAEAVLRPFAESFEDAGRHWAALAPEDRRSNQTQFIADLYASVLANRHLVRVLMGLAHDRQHDELNERTSAWFAEAFTGMGVLSLERARADQISPWEPELRIRAVGSMVLAAAALDDWFLAGRGRPSSRVNVARAMSRMVHAGRRPTDH